MAPGFPIVTEAARPVTVTGASVEAPVIESRLAGAVVCVISGMDDAGRLAAVLRAIRASRVMCAQLPMPPRECINSNRQ